MLFKHLRPVRHIAQRWGNEKKGAGQKSLDITATIREGITKEIIQRRQISRVCVFQTQFLCVRLLWGRSVVNG